MPVNKCYNLYSYFGQVVELADTQRSGRCAPYTGVEVQILSCPQFEVGGRGGGIR